MTTRLAMVVAYDGTDYCGWQIQPDRPTVQGAIEKALALVLRGPVRVEAAGRTDAGVHARGQVVAFRTESSPDLAALQRSLNALLAPDVAVRRVAAVGADFDPRRSARSRTYEYRIHNHVWPSPFCRRYSWHVRERLAPDRMREAVSTLVGEQDFSSFQAADCDAENPVRRILQSELVEAGDDLVCRVTATAFLRHMVRTIVGTLVEVGRGERSADDFRALLAARDRTLAGATAPAHGLCLVAVEYCPDFP